MPGCVQTQPVYVQQPEQLRIVVYYVVGHSQIFNISQLLRKTGRYYVVLLHDKLLSANMTIFYKLLSIFVNSRVKNLVLAICDVYFTGKALAIPNSSMPQCIACSLSPHNVLHSPRNYINVLYQPNAKQRTKTGEALERGYIRRAQLKTGDTRQSSRKISSGVQIFNLCKDHRYSAL